MAASLRGGGSVEQSQNQSLLDSPVWSDCVAPGRYSIKLCTPYVAADVTLGYHYHLDLHWSHVIVGNPSLLMATLTESTRTTVPEGTEGRFKRSCECSGYEKMCYENQHRLATSKEMLKDSHCRSARSAWGL